MSKKNKLSRSKQRHNARCHAMQALYQWQMNPVTSGELLLHFYQDNDLTGCDETYFQTLVKGVVSSHDEIDTLMSAKMDRDIDDLNPVELAVLRLSIFELRECMDVPYKVVINEALNIAKEFGSVEGYKYVNAILDKLSPTLREAEFHR